MIETTQSAVVRSLTSYVQHVVDRHLSIMSQFIPEMAFELENSETIYHAVYGNPIQPFVYLSSEGPDHERGVVGYLIGVMRQCQKTYHLLAIEAIRFHFPSAAVLIVAGEEDYRKLVDRWS